MRTHLLLLAAAASFAAPAFSQTVLFSEDFESGYSRWAMTDLWNAQDASEPCTQAAVPFPSGTHAAWYGSPNSCSFIDGDLDFQYLTCSESIALPAGTDTFELRFKSFSAGEDDNIWDTRIPQVAGDNGVWVPLTKVHSSDRWLNERLDVTRFAGQTIRLRFEFWIGDGTANDFLGWLIDDIEIVQHTEPAIVQCSGDGTWYACPCDNGGGAGRGCANSFNPTGARLSVSGFPSLSADTLSFTAEGMSQAAATVLQGGSFIHVQPWIWSNPGGDGMWCLGTPFVRIRTLPAPGGTLTYPIAPYPPISTVGNITQPWTSRTYLVRYRNAADFCGTSTFNTTNTVQVTWRP